MKTKTTNTAIVSKIVLPALLATISAQVMDGYFSSGNGIKSNGRAGVALTATDDAF